MSGGQGTIRALHRLNVLTKRGSTICGAREASEKKVLAKEDSNKRRRGGRCKQRKAGRRLGGKKAAKKFHQNGPPPPASDKFYLRSYKIQGVKSRKKSLEG